MSETRTPQKVSGQQWLAGVLVGFQLQQIGFQTENATGWLRWQTTCLDLTIRKRVKELQKMGFCHQKPIERCFYIYNMCFYTHISVGFTIQMCRYFSCKDMEFTWFNMIEPFNMGIQPTKLIVFLHVQTRMAWHHQKYWVWVKGTCILGNQNWRP